MAIRFQCSSCSQPIEVDDDWASKVVACPYCRSTSTAPDESTVTDPSEIPTASPVAGGDAGRGFPFPSAERSMAPSNNVLAVVAFALAVGVLGLLAAGTMVMSRHSLELEQLDEELRRLESDSGSRWQAFNEFVNAQGGQVPKWMMASALLHLSAMACSVGAIICGILGLRHAHRRSLAVAALVICGSVMLFFCANVASSMGLLV